MAAYAVAAARTQRAVLVRLPARRESLVIARAVPLDHGEELVPVDLAEHPVLRGRVVVQVGIGEREADRLGLRHREVHEALAQFVVASSASRASAAARAEFGESLSLGPNIMSDGHHQRFSASCTIAFCAGVPFASVATIS